MTPEQLTLGELIDRLERIPDKSQSVRFDFGTAIPTDFDSWRGSYEELELGYELTGYDSNNDRHMAEITVEELLKRCYAADGATYTGWKGGEYKMSRMNRLWISNSGNASETGLVGVVDTGFSVILETWRQDY